MDIQRRIVQGAKEMIQRLIQASQGHGGINTAFIERLNATFRQRLDPLARRTRTLARKADTLTAGMYLVGCLYNFCDPHHSLRVKLWVGSHGYHWVQRTPAHRGGLDRPHLEPGGAVCFQGAAATLGAAQTARSPIPSHLAADRTVVLMTTFKCSYTHQWPACAPHKVSQSIAPMYAESNQRSVQQNILSPAQRPLQAWLAQLRRIGLSQAVAGWHSSADLYGETALPHSSKLSSPLVEPVAYPLGFSYTNCTLNSSYFTVEPQFTEA